MFHQKQKKPRPLGYVHYVPKTPQANSLNIIKLLPSPQSNKEKLKEDIQNKVKLKEDIHNNVKLKEDTHNKVKLKEDSHHNVTAVSVSEDVKDTLVAVFEEPTDQNTVTHFSLTQDTINSHDKCKKTIEEGLKREKELKNETELLCRQLEELKVALSRKEEENKQLQNQLETQETQFRAQLSQEKTTHGQTRAFLQETKEKLMMENERIERLIEEHRKNIEKHKQESQKHLAETVAGKDSVITDRDQKLARLKTQMADALKGNSWERQQQLDELTKELSRIQEENDVLRRSIKSMKKK
ncbi:hypothetical protein BsWGS_21381 [Bradybaena similaris]